MPQQTLIVMSKLKKAGGEDYFPRMHHFSSSLFASEASTFQHHWDYTQGIRRSFQAHGNNIQTCRRVERVLALHARGMSWDDAISQAWNDFPAFPN